MTRRPTSEMSSDWTHQFCLACDKQTDGATYCSESCRLADYEKTSPGSGPCTPNTTGPAFAWTFANPKPTSRPLYLPPAYDFSNPQPYGTTPTRQASSLESGHTARRVPTSTQSLSPSPSHTSLCSIKSSSSTDSTQLSEKATRELRAYARSFESVRVQRRRSC